MTFEVEMLRFGSSAMLVEIRLHFVTMAACAVSLPHIQVTAYKELATSG